LRLRTPAVTQAQTMGLTNLNVITADMVGACCSWLSCAPACLRGLRVHGQAHLVALVLGWLATGPGR
jgi:hypothetical protein